MFKYFSNLYYIHVHVLCAERTVHPFIDPHSGKANKMGMSKIHVSAQSVNQPSLTTIFLASLYV